MKMNQNQAWKSLTWFNMDRLMQKRKLDHVMLCWLF